MSTPAGPLVKTLEAVEDRFSARNQERDVQVGLVRVPIPEYAPESFREAIVNAVQHRDYRRLGAVHIQLQPDHLFLTNPGGFLEGITLDNLLVHEPKPRNPRLSEAFRRLGLVETTGRGIDNIYRGQLRYGRPLPDYTLSDRDGMRLILRSSEASAAYVAFVSAHNQSAEPFSLDELLAFNQLYLERRVDAETIGRLTQRSGRPPGLCSVATAGQPNHPALGRLGLAAP